jgi:hypothetical protein
MITGGRHESVSRWHSADPADDSLTGHVGTALYVAPELATAAVGVKIFYDQVSTRVAVNVSLFHCL